MINQKLKEVFGFDSFKNGQQQVIQTLINGNSCAAIFPTGAGKSLCYQLPAVMLPHLTLVISPLIALMKDQLDFLHSKGIPAAYINSAQSSKEVADIMSDAKGGKIKILMVSVERLKNARFKHFISNIPISLLVIDEAHSISEWGHNFRPDYLKLPLIQNELNIPQVLLLTATATSSVINDMQHSFNISEANTVLTGFNRSNLHISILPCLEDQKKTLLLQLMEAKKNQPTIIYVTLQKTAEIISDYLNQNSVTSLMFHASLPAEIKSETQDKFMRGDINCIVATIAFGMGIDKSNIRNVIHFDLPSSIEGYAQEIGRAGRDGDVSSCILFGDPSGITTLQNFIFGDTPELMAIQSVISKIYDHEKRWLINLSRLSNDANLRPLTLNTLLVYLELNNVIKFDKSYFSTYRFKYNKDQAEIINLIEPHFIELAKQTFQASKKARVWSEINLASLDNPEDSLSLFNILNEMGFITLVGSDMTDEYKIINTDVPQLELAEKIYTLFKMKETADINRLNSMIDLLESDTCIPQKMAKHFGDLSVEKCGNCSACCVLPVKLSKINGISINNDNLAIWVSEIINLGGNELSNIQVSRILCGLASPLVTKIKARKLNAFGVLDKYEFNTVLDYVNNLRG